MNPNPALAASALAILALLPLARGADSAARDAALQAAFGRFSTVAPGVDAEGRALPTTLRLNADPLVHEGVRYDGFRFTAPADGSKLLAWGFRKEPNLSGWFIVPAKGTMRGFTRFFHETDAAKGTTIVQTLPASDLVPGADYLIWFSFKDDQPANLTFWIRFCRPAAVPAGFKAVRELIDPAPEG